MFGYLNSAQIFIEAGGLFLSPLLVRRIGAKNGLLLAGSIMMLRIAGSSFAVGPVSISMLKMLHSVELPILVVSVFRYIAHHFDNRLASTIYMVGVSFGHSLGLAILSPLVGKSYDLLGFPSTYLLLAGLGAVFSRCPPGLLEPTPPEIARGAAAPSNPPAKESNESQPLESGRHRAAARRRGPSATRGPANIDRALGPRTGRGRPQPGALWRPVPGAVEHRRRVSGHRQHEWTNGFWTGMLWLAYELTGAARYREAAERQVLSFHQRQRNA
jgi:hypothetical protein